MDRSVLVMSMNWAYTCFCDSNVRGDRDRFSVDNYDQVRMNVLGGEHIYAADADC